MNILKARVEGRDFILSLSDPSEARRFIFIFKPGDYEIVKAKKKRSGNANRYMWQLAEQIAIATRVTKEDVYRHAIREVGEFLQLALSPSDIPSLEESWTHDRTGWFLEIVDYETDGKRLVFAYKGSSVYDTKAMSRLIDYIVDEAKALDIETLTPDEIERMKQEWR
jgi:tRNA A37 threonylcarbamoyladenosine synthetase subunit TsaC/SUA5/YrdC